jgi:translation initiation factor 2D
MLMVVDFHFLILEWILQVTLIKNLELYGINIEEFARECRHGVGAGASIISDPGEKSQELLVQGNQVLFVGNLLIGIL